MRELRAALAHLGVAECHWLGYRDSGIAGSPSNADPEAFCACDVDEAVGRLVAIVRASRPHVLVTHNEAGGDGHPDHVRAALLARLAYDRAGDPAWYPEQLAGASALAPWSPLKLYEVADQFDRRAKLRRLIADEGILRATPFLVRRLARWRPWKERERAHAAALQAGDRTTRIDVRDWVDRRHAALLEFRSQIGPHDDAIAMTPDERRRMVPTEDFRLRSSRVPAARGEDDLLAGL
jgi:LmbE family N-acetylglucosaminyl deacetylase